MNIENVIKKNHYICLINSIEFLNNMTNRATLRYFFIFLISLITLGSKAQSYRLSPFSYNFELSSSHIVDITQDREGIIWIATQNWINYFDGYTLNSIPYPEDLLQTKNRVINTIHCDQDDNVWIGMAPGILKYNKSDKKYTLIFPIPDNKIHKSNIIYDITEDAEGTIYFGTRNGIYFLKKESQEPVLLKSFAFHEKFNSATKSERIVRSLSFDKLGNLWIGTEGNGLVRLNMKSDSQMVFRNDKNNPNSICGNFITSIFEDQFGVVWIGTTEGLSRFIKEKTEFENFSELSNITVNSITENKSGALLIGTEDGFAIYNRSGSDGFSWFRENDQLTNSLLSNIVTSVYCDHSGAAWVGTSRGISLLMPGAVFQNHKQGVTDSDLTSNLLIFAVPDTARKKIWFGSKNGAIDIYDVKTGKFKKLSLDAVSKTDSKYKNLHTGAMLRNGDLLIGTDAGLIRVPKGEETPVSETLKDKGKELKEIYSIFEDKSGNIWLGVLDRGLYRYNPRTGKLELFNALVKDKPKDVYTNIKWIYEGKDGKIWVVYHLGGVLSFDPAHPAKHKLYTTKTDPNLLSDQILQIADYKSKMLFATTNGIAIFDPATETFTRSPISEATIGSAITGMEIDPKGNIWFATSNQGVARLDLKNKTMIHFAEGDGLVNKKFNNWVNTRIDSTLFFGGDNGLNYINSNIRFPNKYIAAPHILTIKVGSKTISDAKIAKHDVVDLLISNKDKVDISISGFSYLNAWRNRFQYRVIGLDSAFRWIPLGDNTLSLNRLPMGKYKLEIRAANADGFWGIPRIVANITVFPYTATIILIVCIILTAGIAFFIFRKKRMADAKSHEEEIHEHKRIRKEHKDIIPVATKEITDSSVRLMTQLDSLMEKEELYLNKRLNKAQLASYLKLSEQQLTQILKENKQKGFPDYVNSYRIEAVKRKMEEPRYKDFTLWAIGEECGFNSKTSFYRVFKEVTGTTPAEYLEKMNQNK
ncbi:MAG: two-component regulator propeller domain-containing protein [Bacteroidales bacterium]